MEGREVLITGAGGGLGVAVTAAAVKAGARVTAATHGTDSETLAARFGDAVRCIDTDVTDASSVTALLGALPRLDVLLHLAGGFGMGPAHQTPSDDVRRLMDLNLTSTVLVVGGALGRMLEHGYGRIVTVASRNALQPAGQMALYSATKAGVLAYTQAIAEETREHDITANCVLPSIIDTPANRAAMGDADAATWVSPTSLARTILFLGSEAAGDLRGTATQVYGRA